MRHKSGEFDNEKEYAIAHKLEEPGLGSFAHAALRKSAIAQLQVKLNTIALSSVGEKQYRVGSKHIHVEVDRGSDHGGKKKTKAVLIQDHATQRDVTSVCL